MTTFPARFDGRCASDDCDYGDQISPGDEVEYVDDDLMHTACASRARRYGLPRVFRTADFASIYAASCEFRYSVRTSCGVR